MPTDAYIWLYWTQYDTPLKQVKKTLNTYRPFSIGTWWLDCEGEGRDVGWMIARLGYAAKAVESCGIYTRAGWWMEHMGNTDLFSHLPLWYSNPDYTPDFTDYTPFGGWKQPSIKQWMFDQLLRGKVVDMNVYR